MPADHWSMGRTSRHYVVPERKQLDHGHWVYLRDLAELMPGAASIEIRFKGTSFDAVYVVDRWVDSLFMPYFGAPRPVQAVEQDAMLGCYVVEPEWNMTAWFPPEWFHTGSKTQAAAADKKAEKAIADMAKVLNETSDIVYGPVRRLRIR